MMIDIIIGVILLSIAVLTMRIVWKAGEAKIYDPDKVDLSDNFDPQHDHFSKEHAQKVKMLAKSNIQLAEKGQIKSPEAIWNTGTATPTRSTRSEPHEKMSMRGRRSNNDQVHTEPERRVADRRGRKDDRRAMPEYS